MTVCTQCGHTSAESFKFCPECGAPAAVETPSREQRKTVTILFCDVTGSTAIGESTDPEALRALLARYFERMKAIVESHGGTVEKFIGDAVMAVFGVPQVHEDDALRAVRAAVEMGDALPELGVQARMGINTGEVVTGTEETLATGDAVNVAARLEQAASPGEILIGEETLRLVRDAVETEEVERLELKGKSEPVPASRLIAVHDTAGGPPESQFVGRERELTFLDDAWRRACAERSCRLVTVVGEAGLGKSRLALEFLSRLEASFASGRCPPYGEGITYGPVIEVLKQLAVRPSDDSAAQAIASLLGERDDNASADEIAWGVRKTLEEAALERPLVCVFDDIQWGEKTFLDLVEQLALFSSGAPIMLLCTARPELSELRPSWPVDLGLEPLASTDVERMVPETIDPELRGRIAKAAGGNPLFVEQMVATADEAREEVVVPPTLKALLAARLDQLEPGERRVLECAAVEGEVFHRGAVRTLAGANSEVTPRLASLVRRRLIEPGRARIPGEDAFSFHHLLIRDAAYESLTKARRAELHERFADWLEEHAAELVELDELAGYHLEQACGYRAELGQADRAPVDRARRRLAAAGYRAVRRQDYATAVNLLERSGDLLPPDEFDLVLELELRDALFWLGRAEDALRRAEALVERAAEAGNEIAELGGRMLAAAIRWGLEPAGARENMLALYDQAMPVLEQAGDDAALYVAYDFIGWLPRARWDEILEADEKAVAHARKVGHDPPGHTAVSAAGRFFGATPVPELLAWFDEHEASLGRDHFFGAYRAAALAMLGRFDEARGILKASREQLSQRGPSVLLANITAFESVWVELWAGDPAAAVELAAEGWELHAQMSDESFVAAAAGNRAQALYALGLFGEAEAWADRAADDAERGEERGPKALWRQVKAKVLARRGELTEAERLAGEAVELLEQTDYLNQRADTLLDHAEVLRLGDRPSEAAEHARQAIDLYEQKGNVASKTRAESLLAELEVQV